MELVKRAKSVIEGNWRDGFTIPTSRLYPFQWMWDSGFVAMGTGHYNLDYSMEEIRSLLSGQWQNGMIPHILFHSENESTYFPNFDFWNSTINTGAPHAPKSSGITQPAVLGFVLEELYNNYKENEDFIAFLREVHPKVVKYHEFLYNHRDPEEEGLFFIFHPWESGRDNSPIWDDSLDGISIAENEIPAYERRDTQIANAAHRPTKEQYDRYVYLLELGKSHKYDSPEIAEQSPFLIQDSMMNAILIKSNDSLIKLGKLLDLNVSKLEEYQNLSKSNYHKKLWNGDLGFYVCYDQRRKKQVLHKEIGGLIPLFAGIPSQDIADQLAQYLWSIHERGYYLCPSFDVDSTLFDSKRYWRGPVWPQMNWMLYKGLQSYGHNDLAEVVKNDLIELVSDHGFHEYFESKKGLPAESEYGLGGNNFSWTASTVVCLLNEK